MLHHQSKVLRVNWGPDTRRTVSSALDGSVVRQPGRPLIELSQQGIIKVVWDADSSKRIDTFVLPTTWVYACAISPSGELLATGGMDNKCSVFRIRETEYDSGRDKR